MIKTDDWKLEEFEAAKKYNLTLNESKPFISIRSVKLHGYVVPLKLDPEQLQLLRDLKILTPQKSTAMKRCQGMFGYITQNGYQTSMENCNRFCIRTVSI